MLTAGDKLEASKVLVGERQGKWMYVGDSTTDLAVLLEADVGVVMANGEESSLLKTLKRVGFDVPHVNEGKKAQVVWARDFEELMGSGVMDWLSAYSHAESR